MMSADNAPEVIKPELPPSTSKETATSPVIPKFKSASGHYAELAGKIMEALSDEDAKKSPNVDLSGEKQEMLNHFTNLHHEYQISSHKFIMPKIDKYIYNDPFDGLEVKPYIPKQEPQPTPTPSPEYTPLISSSQLQEALVKLHQQNEEWAAKQKTKKQAEQGAPAAAADLYEQIFAEPSNMGFDALTKTYKIDKLKKIAGGFLTKKQSSASLPTPKFTPPPIPTLSPSSSLEDDFIGTYETPKGPTQDELDYGGVKPKPSTGEHLSEEEKAQMQILAQVEEAKKKMEAEKKKREEESLKQRLKLLFGKIKRSAPGSLLSEHHSKVSATPVEVLADIQKKVDQLGERFAAGGILGDSDKIEGHQIDFMYRPANPDSYLGKNWVSLTTATFKMTEPMNETFKTEILPQIPADKVTEESYTFSNEQGDDSEMGQCWVIRIDDGTKIYVSKGGKEWEENQYDITKPIKDKNGHTYDYEKKGTVKRTQEIQSVKGAVRIEVRGETDVNALGQKFQTAFGELGLTEALVHPTTEAEKQYKLARFRWQHRLEDDKIFAEYSKRFKKQNGVELVDHLEREEVFPGYFTVVDRGASEAYQKDGKVFLIHSIYSYRNVPDVLTSGLLSSHERYKRGVLTNGMSTKRDFETGGADSVFLRMYPDTKEIDHSSIYDALLLINPEVLDRTDWYAYESDTYGATSGKVFEQRPSAEEFFANQRKEFTGGNEIMFRRGIPPEMFTGIVVGEESAKAHLILELEKAGTTEINGIPVSEFIKVYNNFGQLRKASK